MKRFTAILQILISALFICSCDRELISSGYPNVITISAKENGEKLIFTGEIINEDNFRVDEVGFIWQNTNDPYKEPGFQVVVPQVSSGYFSSEIAWSLTNNKNYVLRAYAKCGEKVVYGDSLMFNTVLNVPCKLFKIEPDSAFRGDTIKFIGKGFNQTLYNNKVLIDGKNTRIVRSNDSVLVCIVPNELTKGLKPVNILVNGIGGSFEQDFKLLLPPKPIVLSKDATDISWFEAKLNGTVNPNNLPALITFEYGISTAYGQSTDALPNRIDGKSGVDVSATLRTLLPNTTYHYRIKAISESGISYGEDKSFSTLPDPPVPSISSLSSTSIKYGNILKIYGTNLAATMSVLIGNTSQSITVIPKSTTSESIEIEIYNHQNPYQVLGFSSFRVGLVYQEGIIWSDIVNIISNWTRLPDFPASPRYKAGVFTLDGKVYIGAGVSLTGINSDFWCYDPIYGTWISKASIPGSGRVLPKGFSNSNYGYFGSGFSADNSSKVQFKDFYKYTPASNSWVRIEDYPDEISNFYVGYAVTVMGRPFAGLSNTQFKSRELVNDTWQPLNTIYEATQGNQIGAFSIGKCYYLVIGYWVDNTVSNQVWEYNIETAQWTRKADFPGLPRNSGISFSIGNYGYFGCGRTVDPIRQYADMWRFDPAANSWFRINDFPGGLRSHLISCSTNESGYAGLGFLNGNYDYFKDFWRFDP